jgi:response regulator of citrate/malate metabolism
LLKPFTFATLRDKLLRYAEYRQQITAGQSAQGQSEVDRALATLRGVDTVTLPKGLSPETLDLVVGVLRHQPRRSSASEVAAQLTLNRVTARRYLEYLAEQGQAVRAPRHGTGAGRPEMEYGWIATERRPLRSDEQG